MKENSYLALLLLLLEEVVYNSFPRRSVHKLPWDNSPTGKNKNGSNFTRLPELAEFQEIFLIEVNKT